MSKKNSETPNFVNNIGIILVFVSVLAGLFFSINGETTNALLSFILAYMIQGDIKK